MGDSSQSGRCDRNLLERSLLYREFLMEREEILRHKWLESEKRGRDIGFENARVSWVVHHRAEWLRARQRQSAGVRN
jgi:hypothetical protein